ncbi:hypothetical protein BH09MYX1_BH09MYX1_11250 [soil metagenome]
MDFDATANLLAVEIKDDWEESVRAHWTETHEQIKRSLGIQLGQQNVVQKLDNLRDMGAAPFSLIAYHNEFLGHIRDAFVIGAYYPALTASCALGERLLNHLVLALRDDFTSTPEYKQVCRKDSFDNWDRVIRVLTAWDVLLPDAAQKLGDLRAVRNRTVHFSPSTDRNVRAEAREAVSLIQGIISAQFAAFGPQPWYIPNDMGLSLVRKSHERTPFVRRVVLPNCAHVGPWHDLHLGSDGGWRVLDPTIYPDVEIDDEEFLRQMKKRPIPA